MLTKDMVKSSMEAKWRIAGQVNLHPAPPFSALSQ